MASKVSKLEMFFVGMVIVVFFGKLVIFVHYLHLKMSNRPGTGNFPPEELTL